MSISTLYEKSGKDSNKTSYSKQDVTTKKKSKLEVQAKDHPDVHITDVAKLNSRYDREVIAKYNKQSRVLSQSKTVKPKPKSSVLKYNSAFDREKITKYTV